MLITEQQESNSSRMYRIADYVRQSGNILWQSQTHRDVKNLFCKIYDTFHF